MNWLAIGPKGNPLASFSHLDLAERFRDDRAAIGVTVRIVRQVQQRRAA